MATIHRHAIPADSYQPNAPLNDLGREQLNHFIHVAEKLPPEQRIDLPIPSPEDGAAATRYIGAVTQRLLSLRPASLKIVSSQPGKPARKAAAKTASKTIPALAASEAPAKPAGSSAKPGRKKARK